MFNKKNKPKHFVISSLLTAKKNMKKNLYFSKQEIIDLKQVIDSNVCFLPLIKEKDQDIKNLINHFVSQQSVRHNNHYKRKIIFDDELLRFIINNNEQSLTIKEIKAEYCKYNPNAKFCLDTLRKYIQNKLNFSYKECKMKNIKTTDSISDLMMLTFINLYVRLIKDKHLILFADECSFNENKLTKKFWVDKINPIIRSNYGRLKSISVIGAISNTGLIHYSLNNKSNDSNSFISFVKQMQEICEKDNNISHFLNNRKATIILDNSKLHTSKIARRFLRKCRFNILYQPTYSPKVNGIEMIWGLAKRKLARKIEKNREHEIIQELEKYKNHKLDWVYRKVNKELRDFLKEHLQKLEEM